MLWSKYLLSSVCLTALCGFHAEESCCHFCSWLGGKEADRLQNVKNYQCTKFHADHREDPLLFKEKYGQTETACHGNKTSKYCSTAAVNSDWMGLERTEGLNLIGPIEQGLRKWKNEHVMYRLSQCFNCVRATKASHLGWNPLSFRPTLRRFTKIYLSQSWSIYDSSHPCNAGVTVIGLLMWTSWYTSSHQANENSHYMCLEVSLG